MLKKIVLGYLAFALILSPTLCCCTLGRVTAQTVCPSQSVDEPVPSPEQPCSSCGRHSHRDADASDKPNDAPATPPTKQCPCQDHRLQLTLARPDAHESLADVFSFAFDIQVAWSSPALLAALPVSAPATFHLAVSRQIAEDMLRAPHIMRC